MISSAILLATAQLTAALLVISRAGEATEIRDATALPSAITIKVWPSVNEDETPGQDYGPARVVATMPTPVVELVDGVFFSKFHQVWTTVVVREHKNRPGLFNTLYRTHDNCTYVEIPLRGSSHAINVRGRDYIIIHGIKRYTMNNDGLITKEDNALLRVAEKFAETWERGVLHYESVPPSPDRHQSFGDTKVRPELWKPWECALLGEPGAPSPTMKWMHAQTKRGEKMGDLGVVYENPLHYKYLKHFDETFDRNSEGKI